MFYGNHEIRTLYCDENPVALKAIIAFYCVNPSQNISLL
jgi:hypothetical protein